MIAGNMICYRCLNVMLLTFFAYTTVFARTVDRTINSDKAPSVNFSNAFDRADGFIKSEFGEGFRIYSIENHIMFSNEWWNVAAINGQFQVVYFKIRNDMSILRYNIIGNEFLYHFFQSPVSAMEACNSMSSSWPGHGEVLGAYYNYNSDYWIVRCIDAIYVEDKNKGWIRRISEVPRQIHQPDRDISVEVDL